MSILLTGATGFVGGYLCSELLSQTRSPVHCLVRTADRATAARRLRRVLAAQGLPEDLGDRVVAVPADLSRPGLGLTVAARDALSSSITEVVHCAASVNLSAGFEPISAPNVGGTRALIDLGERRIALGEAPLRFHFVSTIATCFYARRAGLPEVDETVVPTPAMAGSFGYALSKVVAESELRDAAARGRLLLTIHRLGVITGHSITGRTSSEADILVPLFRAAIALGLVPETRFCLPMDTVDTVARAITATRTLPESAGRVYHHVRPDPVPLTEFFEALRAAGFRLRTVPADLWWRHVEARAAEPDIFAMAALRSVWSSGLEANVTPRIRSDQTWKALTAAGITPAPLDRAYFTRYVSRLIADGLLAAP